MLVLCNWKQKIIRTSQEHHRALGTLTRMCLINYIIICVVPNSLVCLTVYGRLKDNMRNHTDSTSAKFYQLGFGIGTCEYECGTTLKCGHITSNVL